MFISIYYKVIKKNYWPKTLSLNYFLTKLFLEGCHFYLFFVIFWQAEKFEYVDWCYVDGSYVDGNQHKIWSYSFKIKNKWKTLWQIVSYISILHFYHRYINFYGEILNILQGTSMDIKKNSQLFLGLFLILRSSKFFLLNFG